ncbi:mesoderm posterior aa [Danio aesculapii]|uniref:mesoderm posterior aa n=1 Tax=Danio aesculapii TaxID=1142201 RepID=UPI0024C07C4E|nr:mesoderm posterior aa [Danio aesculapii]
MDASNFSLQLQNCGVFLPDSQNQSFAVSDAGYYSSTGSLSPTSSIDSCAFSPPAYSLPPQIFTKGTQKTDVQPSKKTGRPRSKFPGVKRQTASEREKLRMRDLTKALHHLRTFLPASVAPVGKTLTKIETLRLAIQYISCLSDQLGCGEDEEICEAEGEVINSSASVFDNFSAASLASQSLLAQQFMSISCDQTQNPVEGDFHSFPALDIWFSQQHNFFHGQC